jgi:hypothetical protein
MDESLLGIKPCLKQAIDLMERLHEFVLGPNHVGKGHKDAEPLSIVIVVAARFHALQHRDSGAP